MPLEVGKQYKDLLKRYTVSQDEENLYFAQQFCRFNEGRNLAKRKSYPGHARKVMNAIWGMPGAMFTKCILVVDHDVNVHDSGEVAWKALNHIDPERDIQFTLGPVDQLEHASRLPNFGSKMGIDATRKWPTEGFARPWPDEIVMDPDVRKKVDSLWASLGLKPLGK